VKVVAEEETRASAPPRPERSAEKAADGSAGKPAGSAGHLSTENDLWLLLIEFALSQKAWWTEVCSTQDLTPVQGLALRLLNPGTPMAMNVLADTLACDASNVTGVVDKLEARGLIARQADESDRRVKMLVVTDKGREVRHKLFVEAAKPPAMIAALPRELRDQMSGVLRSLLAQRSPFNPAG
jgi:DNA-binding MarR family transcriptional regulator